ncbi:hypothetical protein PRIPAC_77452 [Pristionchus pacificus]|uniref:Uncharacterized protein n=1 Tax=Pristionchus pacificus TaxID=54126 RepID=A0A2A6BYX4_PRIPA|nr:hypothetical protein PRIPAC_77452 [Pristionchus pacificus]|eukprot:PDM71046.1 hypothetical protein PRIPAC_44442 [Pristionchus pacificus]
MIFLLVALLPLVVAQNQACTYGRDSGDSSCGQLGGQRFYFDSRTKLCQPFYYKGCNGNGNRFSSRAECVSTCSNVTIPSSSSSDGHSSSLIRVLCAAGNVAANDRNGPLSCDKCPHGYECQNGICCGTREYTCSLGYDAGRFPISGSHVPMYFYNKDYKNCMLFTYYGSEGNPNTFPDYNQCRKFCV